MDVDSSAKSNRIEIGMRGHFLFVCAAFRVCFRKLFNKNLNPKLKQLDNYIEDQNAYAQLITNLIDNLEFEDSESKEKQEEKFYVEDFLEFLSFHSSWPQSTNSNEKTIFLKPTL